MFVRPSVRASVSPSVRPSVRPSVWPFVSPSVSPSVRLPVSSSVRPSVRPSVRLPIRPSVRPTVRPSDASVRCLPFADSCRRRCARRRPKGNSQRLLHRSQVDAALCERPHSPLDAGRAVDTGDHPAGWTPCGQATWETTQPAGRRAGSRHGRLPCPLDAERAVDTGDHPAGWTPGGQSTRETTQPAGRHAVGMVTREIRVTRTDSSSANSWYECWITHVT